MMNKKNIFIILPTPEKFPIGGYKIAYQYADFLAGKDYEIFLTYPFFINQKSNISFIKKIKLILGMKYRLSKNQIHAGEWFDFKNSPAKYFVPYLSKHFFKKYVNNSVFIATSVETAYGLKKIKAKNNFYLIQDFENWNKNNDDYVLNSYKLGFNHIVISKWLQEKVESTGAKAVIIPNGLDFEYFKLTSPIEGRSPFEVAMLNHNDERKRCCDSIAALKIVKEKIPELHVTMFGVPERPESLPEWFSYYQKPDRETHNKIYNNAAIFVAASMKEGWALPPAEAMQCGAALVCTDIGGFKDYALNNETALVSPVYDVQKLAENIIKLIKDNNLRIKIAENGYKNIQLFTLEKSYIKFEKELLDKSKF